MNDYVKSGLSSIGIAMLLTAIGVLIIGSLAFFVSVVYSAIFATFNLTLTVLMISVILSEDENQRHNWYNNLELSSILYFGLAFNTLIWRLTYDYAFNDEDFTARTLKSWACGVSVWFVVAISMITLNYTNPDFAAKYVSKGI